MGILDEFGKLFGGGASSEEEVTPKLEDANDQSDDEKKLATFVKSKIEEVRSTSTRISHESIWMTNVAYVLGYDSVYYDPTFKQYYPTNTANKTLRRNRIHSNLILPACQNRLARLCKSPPKYDVRPNSMTEDDKDAARLGIELINDVWDRQRLNKKRLELGMWLMECGHSYLKVSYDNTLGDPLPQIDSNPPGAESLEGPQLDDAQIAGYTGDVRIDVCSSFEIFPDPIAKTLEEASWVIQAKIRPLEYFRTHYPERGHLVKEEGVWLLSTQYEMRINSMTSLVGPNTSTGTGQEIRYSAIELSYYEKKSLKHPQGRLIITANGVLLEDKALPVGEIPFAKFDDVVIGGKYYSEALVTHARPLQDQYNRVLEKRASWTNKMLAGKWLAARGHGLIESSPTNDSGEVMKYDPVPGAPEPKALQVPTIPEYSYKETEFLRNELYQLFGLSEVSRGQLPSASIPAVGMQLLLEQDETRIGIEVEQHEHAFARVGQLILKYIDKFVTMERKLKIKDKLLDTSIRSYTGSDIKKNFDVTVIRGSTIPNSKVIKRQEILNIYGQGLLGDPNDPVVKEQVLSMMEFGEQSDVWKKRSIDMHQINRSIKQIENQEPPYPAPAMMDNHALHIVTKNEYRKSDKFLTLAPISQQLLEQDIQQHVNMGTYMANPQGAMPPDQGPDPMQMLEKVKTDAAAQGIDESQLLAQNNIQA